MKIKITTTILITLLLFTLFFYQSCKKEENKEPLCRITSPSRGDNYEQGETVPIFVDAEGRDANLGEIRFYINNQGVGSAKQPPYSYKWVTNKLEVDTGTYKIKAEAIDLSGNKSSDELNIHIKPGGAPPKAEFASNLKHVTATRIVTFYDRSIYEPTTWKWYFGDGSTSTKQKPTHTYSLEGNYDVSLTVYNKYGKDSITKKQLIRVYPNPPKFENLNPCDWNNDTIFTDQRDDQVYRQTQIGNQCWMAENLNYNLHYTQGEYTCYDTDISNCAVYGKMYDWNSLMQGAGGSSNNPSGVQGICPEGWHVPSNNEWLEMIEYIGGLGSKTKLMETGSAHWEDPQNADNYYGFTALPGGGNTTSGYAGIKKMAIFWTSDTYTWGIIDDIEEIHNSNANGFTHNDYSLRCIKN